MMFRSLLFAVRHTTQHTHLNCSHYRILAAWGYHRQGYCQAGFAAAATKVCDLMVSDGRLCCAILNIVDNLFIIQMIHRGPLWKYFNKLKHFLTGQGQEIKTKCL